MIVKKVVYYDVMSNDVLFQSEEETDHTKSGFGFYPRTDETFIIQGKPVKASLVYGSIYNIFGKQDVLYLQYEVAP